MAASVPSGDEYCITFDRGIEELERLFQLTPASKPCLDAIIVSVDLETSGSKGKNLRVNRKEVSGVREVGFAILDTRVMFPLFPSLNRLRYRRSNSLHLMPLKISRIMTLPISGSVSFQDPAISLRRTSTILSLREMWTLRGHRLTYQKGNASMRYVQWRSTSRSRSAYEHHGNRSQ